MWLRVPPPPLAAAARLARPAAARTRLPLAQVEVQQPGSVLQKMRVELAEGGLLIDGGWQQAWLKAGRNLL